VLSRGRDTAAAAGAAMAAVYRAAGIGYEVYLSGINQRGAEIRD
jgi:hypothetical protein